MANNPKKVSVKKPVTKKPAAKKPVSKPAAKKPAAKKPAAMKPAAKKPAVKPAPKKPVSKKPAARPAQKAVQPKNSSQPVKTITPVKPVQKEAEKDKTASAFDKKIDALSASAGKPQEKSKTGSKVSIALIILILIAAAAYLMYPTDKSKKTEDTAPKEPAAPAQETKAVEQKAVPAVTPKAEDKNIYTVKFKDQLTEISKQVYGNTKEWKSIYEANKETIKDPNIIFPGQKLIIPKNQK